MYDLTTTLMTIAGCSASIAAILGGFIASKLIAINADRDEAETRLGEIEDEIAFLKEERDSLQISLDEDDALDFIIDNIKSLVNQEPLDNVYKEENHFQLTKDDLSPYWVRAEKVRNSLGKYIDSGYPKTVYGYPCGIEENEDGIPVDSACEFSEDFEYNVCKRIFRYLKEARTPLAVTLSSLPNIPSQMWYSKTEDQVNADDTKIDFLELQRKQQQTRLSALKKPKGMGMGITLFTAFSLANIVMPLVLSPFKTDSYASYIEMKALAVGLFSIGLLAILGYIFYLLQWKKER